MPPAPPAFSTITCWAQDFGQPRPPGIRPMMSGPRRRPANGTTMVIGRLGPALRGLPARCAATQARTDGGTDADEAAAC